MNMSQMEKLPISVVDRATQIRMHLQQDIVVKNKSVARRSFVTSYLKHWSIPKDYEEMGVVQKLYAEHLPWSDWFDTW